MKNAHTLLLILSVLFFNSCTSTKNLSTLNNGKQIDKRLVGIWTGSEKDNQIEGLSKEWKMTRTFDGNFSLEFKVTQNGKVRNSTEDGQWWIENGLFHEMHFVSQKTDIYEYKVLNSDQIKFKVKSFGVAHENEEYEFIDTRLK